MSEFEFIYMLNEIENSMWMAVMNFISIIFAMLVTAYFIAARLTRIMTWALLSLFSMAAGLFAGSALTARLDIVTLAYAARKTLLAAPSEIPSMAMFNASEAEIMLMNVALILIMGFAYIASMIFFFQARKQGTPTLSVGGDA